MKRVMTITAVVIGLGVAASAPAQTQPGRHLSGISVHEQFTWQPATQTTSVTATLRFAARDDGRTITIDFKTQHRGMAGGPHEAPAMVDVVVTQHPSREDTPMMSMRVNGQPQQLAARTYGRESVAATIPFDEFVRLANAASVIEQAFDSELEFSTAQLRMLRNTAERWSGQ